MEIGRTRCIVLGYHIKGIRARLLCRPGLPYRIHQSMRRNSLVPVRLLPSARHQPLLIRGQIRSKPDAYFDFELFKKHVALAQRIMDDIIDLELEKIERIMGKIDADPESEDVKHTERVLWQKIYKKKRPRPPYRCRHHGRRRHACRPGIALWH